MRARLLAGALLLGAAAGAGWVAATPAAAGVDAVTTTDPGPVQGWTIVALDASTGRSVGVFAGPGDGPAVVPGFGFTESYLAQLRATQASAGTTLLSSVTGPDVRTDTALGPVGDAVDVARPAPAALAVASLLVAVLLGPRRTRRAATGAGLLLAGALGALTVGFGTLGTWSPALGAAALAAGVAALVLRRPTVPGAPA